jgi:ABC-type methionine transport system ATPase subunit
LIDEIIELEMELQRARGEDPDRKYRLRTAKLQQRRQDIKILSQGYNALDSATIAQVLNIPIETVEMERARIQSNNKLKTQLEIATGHLDPDEGASVAIYQR